MGWLKEILAWAEKNSSKMIHFIRKDPDGMTRRSDFPPCAFKHKKRSKKQRSYLIGYKKRLVRGEPDKGKPRNWLKSCKNWNKIYRRPNSRTNKSRNKTRRKSVEKLPKNAWKSLKREKSSKSKKCNK